MSKQIQCFLFVAVVLAGPAEYGRWLSPAPAYAEPQVRAQASTFNPQDFAPRQVVPAREPIRNPQAIDVTEADGKVEPNELVLGVEVNGEARAYPINMLTGPSREIFNDELGDSVIAATW